MGRRQDASAPRKVCARCVESAPTTLPRNHAPPHHRAFPHQGRRADPDDDLPRARPHPEGRALQPVRRASRRRGHRSAHRLRDGRYERRAMGRDDARRRVVRRRPELLPLRRRGAIADRDALRVSHPSGARRRAHPVRRHAAGGQGRPVQRALRHDPGQRRGRWRDGPGPVEVGRAGRARPVRRRHGHRGVRPRDGGPARGGGVRRDDDHQQHGRRAGRVARQPARGLQALPRRPRPARARCLPVRRERLPHPPRRTRRTGPSARVDRARVLRSERRLHHERQEGRNREHGWHAWHARRRARRPSPRRADSHRGLPELRGPRGP